ncbi:MAG: DUF350 domain-containing protein [Verrucomicrobiota bacterium]
MNHTMPEALMATAAFGLVGILLSVIGYKIFDAVIPVSFSKELQNGNIAIGILCGSIVIGICHVIAAALG